MATANISWSFQGNARTATVDVNVPAGAPATAPLVILLHGTGGDINDMSDPAVHPGFAVERVAEGTVRDRGWWDYSNVGYWSLGVDPNVAVTGWAPYLTARGFPVLNYSQVDPGGRLTRTVAELIAILGAIEGQRLGQTNVAALEPVKNRETVLVGHSRGGILARQALVDLAAAADPALARIRTCITLHSPNAGSNLANVALAVAALASGWRAQIALLPVPTDVRQTALTGVDGILAMIQTQAGQPAFMDFTVGAPVLAAIAAQEGATGVPGVEYFSFGGTRPVLLNVRGWAFSLDSAIPQLNSPPFRWRTSYQTLLPLPPVNLGLPELTPGVGDILTAAPLTRLPFSVHYDNALNHAEALWDPTLQTQVLAILNRAPLPQTFIVDCVTPDSDDPGRAIDAFGGVGPTGGRWNLTLAEALALVDRGTPLFVRRADGRLIALQRVRRRFGSRYLRAPPGAGAPRLGDLPRCP